MPRSRIVALALAGVMAATGAAAQEGIERTPIDRQEVPGSGYVTVMGTAELAPGATTGRHTHPGVEMGYVLEGDSELLIDGQAPQRLAAGQSYRIEPGVVHEARNTGATAAMVIAVWVVEKDKPLAVPAD